jgi:drug/metabolite transporter (DMT)-like permease
VSGVAAASSGRPIHDRGAISADAALAVLGVTAVLVGALRLWAPIATTRGRPRLSRRIVLGVGEVVIGVVWITTDEVSPT